MITILIILLDLAFASAGEDWQDIKGELIRYEAQKTVSNDVPTLEACKNLCVQETTFNCRSIDYVDSPNTKICKLNYESTIAHNKTIWSYCHADRIGEVWNDIPGGYLNGFDGKAIFNVPNLEACKELCIQESTFDCSSVNHIVGSKTCSLKVENNNSHPELLSVFHHADRLNPFEVSDNCTEFLQTNTSHSRGAMLIVTEDETNKIHFIEPNSKLEATGLSGFQSDNETRLFDYKRDGTFSFFDRPHSCFDWLVPQWLFFAPCGSKFADNSVCLFKSLAFPNSEGDILVAGPLSVDLKAIKEVKCSPYETLIIWSEGSWESDYPIEDIPMDDILTEDIFTEDLLTEDLLTDDILIEDIPTDDFPTETKDDFTTKRTPEVLATDTNNDIKNYGLRAFNYSIEGNLEPEQFLSSNSECNCEPVEFGDFQDPTFQLVWNSSNSTTYTFYYTTHSFKKIVRTLDRCHCEAFLTSDVKFRDFVTDNHNVYYTTDFGHRSFRAYPQQLLVVDIKEYYSDLQIGFREDLKLIPSSGVAVQLGGGCFGRKLQMGRAGSLLLYNPDSQRPLDPAHCARIGKVYETQKVGTATLNVVFGFVCPTACRCPSTEFALEIGYISCNQTEGSLVTDGVAFEANLTQTLHIDCGLFLNVTLRDSDGEIADRRVVNNTRDVPIIVKSRSVWIIILIVFLLLIILFLFLFLVAFYWKRRKFYKGTLPVIHAHDLEISIDKILGSGNFSTVYLGKLKYLRGFQATETPRIDLDPMEQRVFHLLSQQGRLRNVIQAFERTYINEKIRLLMDEAIIMGSLDHPHILKIRGIVLDSEPRKLVLELMDGSLDKFIHSTPIGLPPETLLSISRQIVAACEYLDEKSIVHLDISARNCLYKRKRGNAITAKLSDFGLAKQLRKKKPHIFSLFPKVLRLLTPKTNRISSQSGVHSAFIAEQKKISASIAKDGNLPVISAPELTDKTHESYPECSSKCDVYLVGSLLVELFAARGTQPSEILKLTPPERQETLEDIPSGVRQVIMECWESSPELRPTIQILGTHLREVKVIRSDAYAPAPAEARPVDRELLDRELIDDREFKHQYNSDYTQISL